MYEYLSRIEEHIGVVIRQTAELMDLYPILRTAFRLPARFDDCPLCPVYMRCLQICNYEGYNFNSGNYLFTTDTK